LGSPLGLKAGVCIYRAEKACGERRVDPLKEL
jgi:hypothetical protein